VGGIFFGASVGGVCIGCSCVGGIRDFELVIGCICDLYVSIGWSYV